MAYYSDTTGTGTILLGKYPDLSVGDDADDDVTQVQLNDAAQWAYARINSRLAKRYSVPFSTTDPPDAIREISDMLTVCWLKATASGHSLAVKGPWTEHRAMAEAWLTELADGTATLPEVAQSATSAGLYISTEGEHPVMGMLDDDYDMGQDPDQAERIADERD